MKPLDPDNMQLELADDPPLEVGPLIRDALTEDLLAAVDDSEPAARSFNPSLHPHDPHSGEFVHTPGSGLLDRLAKALSRQDALDAVPARLERAERGHFGDYSGEKLHGPAGMGSVRALSEYEGVEYHTINTFLRGGYKGATGREDFLAGTRERIAEIDKTMAVSRLTHDVKVDRVIKDGSAVFGHENWYRGVVDFNEPNLDVQDQQWERWDAGARPDLTGLRWTEPAYSSTTADPQVAKKFGKGWPTSNSTSEGEPVIMTIFVSKGTGAVQMAEMGHAAEILLQRGLTYEVIADHGVGPDGFRLLDVQVVA